MQHRMARFSAPVVLAGLVLAQLLAACLSNPKVREVVVYTSVDQVYSEPILKGFEAQTGIRALAVYDVEATKTTGLANRLMAEKDRPQADVFWNGEFSQTLLLKAQGLLAPYASPEGQALPELFRDPEGYWTGFGGRARVILVNTDAIPSPADYPDSIFDLLESQWPAEQIGIANPLFGTTATQAAALYAALGREEARQFYEEVEARGVQVVDGNSVVRDMVAGGQLAFGLTDTDDACGALQRGAPVAVVFPDQAEGGLGTLVVPNTVAVVAGGPNPEAAKSLVDYLLSSGVEAELVRSGWFSFPLHAEALAGGPPAPCPLDAEVRGMQVSFAGIYDHLEPTKEDLTEIFIR